MSNLTIALYSLMWVGLALVIYRFVFNPQLVLTISRGNASQCPERWSFMNGMCHPNYSTKCIQFDPRTITSVQQGCTLARSCGTDWIGMCA